MRTVITGIVPPAVFFIVLFTAFGCNKKYERKTTNNIVTDRADRGLAVKDPSFDLSGVKKIYIYSQQENDSELKTLENLQKKLRAVGYDIVLDHGQTLDYTDDDLRIRAYHKLMSIMHYLYIVKPKQKKGHEDVIAVIKADSAAKLSEITAGFLLKHRGQSQGE